MTTQHCAIMSCLHDNDCQSNMIESDSVKEVLNFLLSYAIEHNHSKVLSEVNVNDYTWSYNIDFIPAINTIIVLHNGITIACFTNLSSAISVFTLDEAENIFITTFYDYVASYFNSLVKRF